MSKSIIYTSGGTVQAGNGIYLSRQADQELLNLCQQGSFAYVLTPRQLGKSSLMIRTAQRLAEEGIQSVIIDLTQIGTEVSIDAWYLGLLTLIEDQLMLTINVLEWWQQHSHLGVTQRLTQFFQKVLLAEVNGSVVIFVDEIDTTLRLDFTDDFYAAIRFLYVTRAQQPELKRLSVVLIGVATPGDLIRDPKRTPFNIGQRVDLTDFTLEEAMPLATGLCVSESEAQHTLKQILMWTGGHPYLTQRLCQSLVETSLGPWTDEQITKVVNQTFLGSQSEQDNNLQFVRDMLTKRAPDPEMVLQTYRQIRQGRRPVIDEEQNLAKSYLKLSGVVRRVDTYLIVRNQIYWEVFNTQWVREHLPETFWQRYKPVLKWAIPLTAASITVAIGMTRLAAEAQRQKDLALQNQLIAQENELRAKENELRARKQEQELQTSLLNEQKAKLDLQAALRETKIQKQRAEEQAFIARKQTAIAKAEKLKAEQQANISLARQLAAQGSQIRDQPAYLITRNVLLSVEAMRRLRTLGITSVEADLALRQGLSLLSHPVEPIQPPNNILNRISQQENVITSADQQYEARIDRETDNLGLVAQSTIRIINIATGQEINRFLFDGSVSVLDLSSGAKYLAIASSTVGPSIKIFKVDSKDNILNIYLSQNPGATVFSEDSRFFALSYGYQTATQEILTDFPIQVWNLESRLEVARVTHNPPDTSKLIFSHNNNYLTAVSVNGSYRTWKIPGGSELIKILSDKLISRIAVSPRAEYLALADIDHNLKVFRVDTREKILQSKSRLGIIDIAFNSNKNLIALGAEITRGSESSKGELEVFNASNGQQILKVDLEDGSQVYNSLLSPNGRYLISGGYKVWELRNRRVTMLLSSFSQIRSWHPIAFSPDGNYIVRMDANGINLWSLLSRRKVYERGNMPNYIFHPDTTISLSPNRKYLLFSSWRSKSARIEDIQSGRIITDVRHDDTILSTAFAPDGNHFATGSYDGTARVWEIASGKEVAQIHHEDKVSSVQFSSDSKYLATATSNGIAQINLWKPEDMIAEACSRVYRNLDIQEWQQFIGNEPYRKTCPGLKEL